MRHSGNHRLEPQPICGKRKNRTQGIDTAHRLALGFQPDAKKHCRNQFAGLQLSVPRTQLRLAKHTPRAEVISQLGRLLLPVCSVHRHTHQPLPADDAGQASGKCTNARKPRKFHCLDLAVKTCALFANHQTGKKALPFLSNSEASFFTQKPGFILVSFWKCLEFMWTYAKTFCRHQPIRGNSF